MWQPIIRLVTRPNKRRSSFVWWSNQWRPNTFPWMVKCILGLSWDPSNQQALVYMGLCEWQSVQWLNDVPVVVGMNIDMKNYSMRDLYHNIQRSRWLGCSILAIGFYLIFFFFNHLSINEKRALSNDYSIHYPVGLFLLRMCLQTFSAAYVVAVVMCIVVFLCFKTSLRVHISAFIEITCLVCPIMQLPYSFKTSRANFELTSAFFTFMPA